MTIETVLTILFFTVAAAAGAVLRHLIIGYLNTEFPVGTLTVNLVGSLLLGTVASLDDPVPVVVGIGALGALSVWSTVANEVATMARAGRGGLAAGYLVLTATSGVLAAWFGLKLGSLLW